MSDIDHAANLERIAKLRELEWADTDDLEEAATHIRRLRSYDFGRAERYALIVGHVCRLLGIDEACSPSEVREAIEKLRAARDHLRERVAMTEGRS